MKMRREVWVVIIVTIALFGTAANAWLNVMGPLLAIERTSKRTAFIKEIIGDVRVRRQLAETLRVREQDLESFLVRMPSRDKYPEFIQRLHEIGNRTGVEVLNTSLEPFSRVNKKGMFEALTLRMPLRGPYRSIRNFVLEVERFNELVRVSNIKLITRGNQDDSDSDLNLEIVFLIYFKIANV
ncbi:MAG: hypothetical protein CVV64_01560 [Candidatus Wallbacteria bacterium HGW-Wallbacteria-1]|jgi:Tfp pilus assembly protein PilO|uniref:Pilus assembly protein PilO n=1 Tax=Candidatus Wallbacteria bacterium HGW-Wallbacteria-1 TaxID=2013854 RepID=A0A2N1PV04_9BACT|nr:MAG: hypothetical protein CVV64_01560 [Candidatus Wallbacteria bacterium HGW-Wallbacteria-1]